MPVTQEARIAVVVDTNIFFHEQYRFRKSKLLNQLADLCSEGLVKVVLPHVVEQEILVDLKEASSKIRSAHRQYMKTAAAIRDLDSPISAPVGEKLDEDQIKTLLVSEFENFKVRTNTEVLNDTGADTAAILQRYFSKLPPFGTGKKAEFPDAFALDQVNKYISSSKAEHVVVSNDDGWDQFFCANTRVKYFRSLDLAMKTIVILLAGAKESEALEKANKLIEENIHLFDEKIIAHLKESYFEVDEDGEVLETDDFRVTYSRSSIYAFDLKSAVAAIFIRAEVSLSAQVSLLDTNESSWAPEDKAYTFKVYQRSSGDFTIDVEFEFDVNFDEKFSEIENIELDSESAPDSFTLMIESIDPRYD